MAKHSYIIVGQDTNNVPQETVILYHITTTATNGFNTADIITAYTTNDFDLDDQGGNASSIPSFSFSTSYSKFSCLEYREHNVSSGPDLSTLFTTANNIKNSTTDLNTQIVTQGLYATGLDQYSTNVSINTGLGSADTVYSDDVYVEIESNPYYVVYSDYATTVHGSYWNSTIGIIDSEDNSFNVSLTTGDLFGDSDNVSSGTHVRNMRRALTALASATTDSDNAQTFNKVLIMILEDLITYDDYKDLLKIHKIKNKLTADEFALAKTHLYI